MVARQELNDALAERHGGKLQEIFPGRELPLQAWEDWGLMLPSTLPEQASGICI